MLNVKCDVEIYTPYTFLKYHRKVKMNHIVIHRYTWRVFHNQYITYWFMKDPPVGPSPREVNLIDGNLPVFSSLQP